MNYVDLVIILMIIFYAYSGYRHGFLKVFFDMSALVISFVIALYSYLSVSGYVGRAFGLQENYAVVVGFFISWLAAEMLFFISIQLLYPKIPGYVKRSVWNKYLGIAPSVVKGLFIISIFVATLATVPFSTKIKGEILSSMIGKPLAKNIKVLDMAMDRIFGGAFRESVSFLTIKPESDETIDLEFNAESLTIDSTSEIKMLEFINNEREKEGLSKVTLASEITEVARKHSTDMFEKSYFAHENKEGLSPFDRMERGGIDFLVAGENLALAPDVEAAHKGLMESQGHRENILSPDFGRVGIGVIDGGEYGKMFTQNFTD